MTKVDLVKQWKEAARHDDLFDYMVPSDVRQMIGEIEQLRTKRDNYKADYLRRHKDAADCFEECIRLRATIKANKANQKLMLTNRTLYEG